MNPLSGNISVTLVNAAAVSAGTAINTASVDVAGFDGVLFIGSIATYNASNAVNAATSSDDSTFNDLAGTGNLPGDDADSFLIDVHKPLERYIRVEIARTGANTAVGDIYAIRYGANKSAPSHGTTVDSEITLSPAEGTA